MDLDELQRHAAQLRAAYDAIYSQDNPQTDAGGWLQWKGTESTDNVHTF